MPAALVDRFHIYSSVWSTRSVELLLIVEEEVRSSKDGRKYMQYNGVQCCVMLYTQAERGLLESCGEHVPTRSLGYYFLITNNKQLKTISTSMDPILTQRLSKTLLVTLSFFRNGAKNWLGKIIFIWSLSAYKLVRIRIDGSHQISDLSQHVNSK